MKILMINKFHYIKGGSETYYFSLKRLLEEHGHKVIDFSMEDEKNFPSPYEKYFIHKVEYNGKTSFSEKIGMVSRIIYSKEAQRKLALLIEETKPDLAHLHLFQHQMSPSILHTLKKYKIPTVYTAHELKMLCPNYKMLNRTGICERCKGHHYYNCMKYNCIKNSKTKSMICMIEAYLHEFLKSYDYISKIITPSKFYYDKFVEFGVKKERLCHIPNFLEEEKIEIIENSEVPEKSYYLYLGRISEEKGISTMIKAFQGMNLSLKIAGTGPILESLQAEVKKQNQNKIEFLGFKQGEELQNLVRNAKAIILPSEWYENGPYSGIEAISQGKILIGSDMGGIPELIEDYKSGFIFHAGDAIALKQCVQRVEELSSEEIRGMQSAARALFEKNHTAKGHYEKLFKVYQDVLGRN